MHEEDEALVDECLVVGSGTLDNEYSSGIERKFVSFSHFTDISSSSVFELSSSPLSDRESKPEKQKTNFRV